MQLLSSALLSGSIIDLDGTIFVQAAIFFVAFVLLRSIVFKPMVALFEAREAAIDGAKAEAERLQTEAASAGQSFEDELRKVRAQAQAERDKLRADALKREREILDTVKAETDKSMAEADARLSSQSEALRKEIQASVPGLARQIASKLLQREVA